MTYTGGKVGTSGPMGDIEFNYSDNVDVAVINNGKGSPTVRLIGPASDGWCASKGVTQMSPQWLQAVRAGWPVANLSVCCALLSRRVQPPMITYLPSVPACGLYSISVMQSKNFRMLMNPLVDMVVTFLPNGTSLLYLQ